MTSAPLLPSGLYDLLPDEAQADLFITRTLINHFNSCGYLPVSPPLMEYESSLISGSGEAYRELSFRVMDPLNGQMMALRADMTMQIARIAGSLLRDAPRPLRLCYNGQTLRRTPDAMRISRQFRQIGIELFGADSAIADVDIIQTAVSSLTALGINDLLVDIHLPPLFAALTAGMEKQAVAQCREAVRRRDSAALKDTPILAALLDIPAPVERALSALRALSLPETTKPLLTRLETLVELLQRRFNKNISITIDPLDLQGFDYYQGMSFSIYLKDAQALAGRGGNYQTPYGESATGFTLYTEDLLAHILLNRSENKILLASDTSEEVAATLRKEGFITLYAATDALEAEAKQLGISWIYQNHQKTKVG